LGSGAARTAEAKMTIMAKQKMNFIILTEKRNNCDLLNLFHSQSNNVVVPTQKVIINKK
jgi:hypothetical protein